MKIVTYFRIALLLPTLLAVIGFAQSSTNSREFGLFKFASEAIVIAGIPYLCFVLVMFVWTHNRQALNIIKAFWLSPLLFGGFCFFYFALAPEIDGQINHANQDPAVALFFALFALASSYVCSITTLLIWVVLKRVISAAPAQTDA